MQADRTAGGELVNRHHATLLRWITAHAGKKNARDLVQTTWLLAQRSNAFTGRGSFQGWLQAIARSQMMRPERRGAWLTPATPTSAMRRVLRQQVIDAIDELTTDEQREAARLAWVAGFSAREISAQSGVKLETIRSRLKLALAKLRAYLSTKR